jgi:hypothetical protein
MKAVLSKAVAAIAAAWMAVPAVAAAQTTPGDVITQVIEPVSGATVRVYRTPMGEAAFDVLGPGVTIGKRVTPQGTMTTFAAEGERVSVLLTPSRLVIEGLGDRLDVARGSRRDADVVRARAASSRAMRRAAALLNGARFREWSPLAPTLHATRLMLQSLAGEKVTGRADVDVAAWLKGRANTRNVSLGPGDCWTIYAVEAIATYIEYEQCVDAEQWWDVFGLASCLIIYEMRAIGAYTWWLSCIGLGNFIG